MRTIQHAAPGGNLEAMVQPGVMIRLAPHRPIATLKRAQDAQFASRADARIVDLSPSRTGGQADAR